MSAFRKCAVLAAAIAFVISNPLPAKAQSNSKAREEQFYVVDLFKGTIDGKKVFVDVEVLIRSLGASRVKKYYYSAEGARQVGHHIFYGSHHVDREPPFIRIKDSAFRTKEGLSVGYKVKDFAAVYGEGALYGPGPCILFQKPEKELFLLVRCSYNTPDYPDPKSYYKCIVKEIMFYSGAMRLSLNTMASNQAVQRTRTASAVHDKPPAGSTILPASADGRR